MPTAIAMAATSPPLVSSRMVVLTRLSYGWGACVALSKQSVFTSPAG
jgi:hypothetical protein